MMGAGPALEPKGRLRGSRFMDVTIRGLDLSESDLRDAHFERVLMEDCDLSSADLRGAHFVGCDLNGVALANVRLGDNSFDGTSLVDVEGLSREDRLLIVQAGGAFQAPHASSR